MLKFIYIAVIIVSVIFLMIIYFTNIIYLWSMQLFLWSQRSHISLAAGLALIILVSMILGASIVLLLKSLINQKPKDFDEFDL